MSGTDVGAAVDGVATIIHCSGSTKGDEIAAQNLVKAAARARRPHLVYISVVGTDRIPASGAIDRMMFSYFDMKRKAEDVVAGSGLPWTTLRATQVHDLILMVLEKLARLPVILVPSPLRSNRSTPTRSPRDWSSSGWGNRLVSFPT